MLFGLCNTPRMFQYYMNELFRDSFLDKFLIIYLHQENLFLAW